MSSVVYLYIAYAAALLLIGGYVVYLVRQVASLRSEIDGLKQPEER